MLNGSPLPFRFTPQDGALWAAVLAGWSLSYAWLSRGPFKRLVERLVPLPTRPTAPTLQQKREQEAGPTIRAIGKQDSGVLLPIPISGKGDLTAAAAAAGGATDRAEPGDEVRLRRVPSATTLSTPIAPAGSKQGAQAEPTEEQEAAYQHLLHTQRKNRVKAEVSLWKLYSFTVTSLLGAVVLGSTSWAWRPDQYFVDFHLPPSLGMRFLYALGFASYAHASCVMFWMPKQKDFAQMIVHHLATLFLIAVSYAFGQTRVGSVILFLHDVSDPFMEAAKAADGLFVLFAAVFLFTRNYLFPVHVILTIPTHLYDAQGATITAFSEFVRPYCVAALWTLEALHVYWASLILKMIGLAVLQNGVEGDVRDED